MSNEPTVAVHVGQRVRRKDSDEQGTVVEANGEVKVKWDGGSTSYAKRGKPGNIRLCPTD